jgi:cyclic beta-1,2-glucan synthetase
VPFEAYICQTAVVTALWRMLVSHRGLLHWTPVSAFEGSARGAGKYIRAMWFSLLAGITLLIFAAGWAGRLAGVIWLLSPILAFYLSQDLRKKDGVSGPDQSYLLSCAKRIWLFFEDFCTADDNYLPPDNWQERPPAGIAHRTSPTNIGLCLLSCVSAIDLGIAAEQNAIGIIRNILNTLKHLPKWNGHLYNWYDTRTLRPLHPAYVSAVDSGNLAACLMILREALTEYAYPALAEACGALLPAMSFEPLYNRSHRLFAIGIDTDKNQITDSFYDLMASEARTAGFIAIARGDAPRRHWRSLSRAQVRKDGYRGMVSWTGSMFEYLMPRLFFASAEGSLMYESLRFAVEVQKKDGRHRGLPWGVSESAFYSLDPGLNYRYKAHGCGALALKRNMSDEYVVSPYSSFLALPCGAGEAVKNLRKLEKLGAWGKYGFWEAVDFTNGGASGKKGEVVFCVMAHHAGMSLIAISNVLCGDLMPRRFMRDPAIAAHACLLDEKLPLGGVVLRRHEDCPPEKPPRTGSVYWEKQGEHADFFRPACCLLSNGDYNIMLTEFGAARALWGRITPYFTPKGLPAFSHGLALYLRRGDALISLLPIPGQDGRTKITWNFKLSSANISLEQNGLHANISFGVSTSANGEKRIITLSSDENVTETCELIAMFEPVLAGYNDYINHPAFFRLGLHAGLHESALVVKRLKRDGVPECFLCLAASSPMTFSARRGLVPGRGGLLKAIETNIPSAMGWLSDPMICARIPVRLSRGAESTVALALAVAEDENAACAAANRILTGGEADSADFPSALASELRMSEALTADAMALLRRLLRASAGGESPLPARSALWRFGISGNLPVLTHAVAGQDDLEEAEGLMRQHTFLDLLSCPYDLVFITDEGGDYLRPMATALAELRRTAGLESINICIADRSQNIEALLACSLTERKNSFAPVDLTDILSLEGSQAYQKFPDFRWDENGDFEFYVNHSLPPRAWQNILSNGAFGFIATDCGTGHMWFRNAREYRINRWLCDSLTASGTETLTLSGRSLFAEADDTDCTVRFGPGYAVWEKALGSERIRTTAFVPQDYDARVLLVERADGGRLSLGWSTDLVLSGDAAASSRARLSRTERGFSAENPESPFPGAAFRIIASSPPAGFTTDRGAWLRGVTDGSLEQGGFAGLRFESESPFVLVCGCEEERRLAELCTPGAARASLEDSVRHWRNALSAVRVKTPLPALDRLINLWLPYQALACRIMGRCSIYQSGGATGFRDQLQDAVNLLLINSSLARAQLTEACRHQYEQGDVMHWWHTLGNETKGVRTHCSDDLLWLPWALCEYAEKTGDLSLCAVPVSWLTSPPLRRGETDRYETASRTDAASPVLEHAERAMALILARGTGSHGLLKIGSGDWNDGMDQVGAKGAGESVWLTWFFSHTGHRFAALLRRRGRPADAEKYARAAAALGKSANAAWDGHWYLRGYFDDGTPLGSASQPCCSIDSVAQSFAALSPEADKSRVAASLTSAVERLFDRENKIIRLFDPPFENASPSPGYIESYGPGFRENGGQYTHGAIWLAMALLRQGRADEALELICALIPETHDPAIYEAEPFVLPADVYGNPDCPGLAGWSWYTGSAGWFYRVVTEELLGIKLSDGRLSFSPRFPSGWDSCEVTLRDSAGRERHFTLGRENAKALPAPKRQTREL